MSVCRKIILTLIIAVLSNSAFTLTTGDLIIADKTGIDWPSAALERPTMQYEYATSNFLIHYNTVGDSAVYHPDEDNYPSDNVPDYVNRVGEYFESAHQVYIYELEYDIPPPDNISLDGNRYDVFITTASGLTTPEYQSNYYPGRDAYVSYIQVGNNMITENHPEDPYPYLQGVCAHEYFHAVQMAYRANPSDEKPWFYELTAMWAEERVFDDLNELYYNLEDYYSDIDQSIYLQGGLQMYGAWVLAEYLSQNYGNDIIKKIFERLIINPSSISSLIRVLEDYDSDLNTEFTLLTGWNYFTGDNYYPGFFEEAMDFPTTVPLLASHDEYPVDWQNYDNVIANLGVSYIYFENPGISDDKLIIEVQSDSRYTEGVCVGCIYDDNRPIELQTYKLYMGECQEIKVNKFSECNGVFMAVNWSYEGQSNYGTAGFSYKAQLDTDMVGIIADTEPVIPEGVTLTGNYPNPFNLSTEITFYWNLNPSYYKLALYDITGKQVDLIRGNAVAGENRVNWKANDNLSSGVYFYRLTTGEYSGNGRMLLVK